MADIKSLSVKKFFSLLPDRQAKFNSAAAVLPNTPDNAMALAKALHPKRQYLKVEKIDELTEDCRSYTLVPDEIKGTASLAYFGAGKYLTVFETIEGMAVTRLSLIHI